MFLASYVLAPEKFVAYAVFTAMPFSCRSCINRDLIMLGASGKGIPKAAAPLPGGWGSTVLVPVLQY